LLYHNVRTACDAWFRDDATQRAHNDQETFGKPISDPAAICPNQLRAGYTSGDAWYVESMREDGGKVTANAAGDIVIVGSNYNTLEVSLQSSESDICRYRYIEDALNDTDTSDGCGNFERPPFLELSCAGWRNAPAGCETTRGYLDAVPNNDTSGALTGAAYEHVTPSDVGQKIGMGVIDSVPTEEYTGPSRITSPTTIENKVIDSCLRIESDDVTIRNSQVNCGGLYPIQVKNGSQNFVFEYNEVQCTSRSKMFYFVSGAPNAQVRYNHGVGCDDFFYMNGNLEGVNVAYNYLHTTTAVPDSHSDGFQIGTPGPAYGTFTIKGNYFDPNNPDAGETGLVFSSNSDASVIVENNRIFPWGYYTLRSNGGEPQMVARNNVFSSEEETEGVTIVLGGNWNLSCNRYEDGSFPSDSILGGNVTTNCPAY
jgi:hypothetical protein